MPQTCPRCSSPFYAYWPKDRYQCLSCECEWLSVDSCESRPVVDPCDGLSDIGTLFWNCLVTAMAEHYLPLTAAPGVYITRAITLFEKHGGITGKVN